MKKAIVTGITGQDGSYLAQLLLAKGYEVHGVVRRASSFNTQRIDHIYQDPHQPGARLKLHYGDLNDGSNLADIVRRVDPDEVYNLAAQSHVRVSFDMPVYTVDTDALGALKLLVNGVPAAVGPGHNAPSSSQAVTTADVSRLLRAALEQLHDIAHTSERIAYLVGNSCREQSKISHFFLLQHLCLSFLQLARAFREPHFKIRLTSYKRTIEAP